MMTWLWTTLTIAFLCGGVRCEDTKAAAATATLAKLLNGTGGDTLLPVVDLEAPVYPGGYAELNIGYLSTVFRNRSPFYHFDVAWLNQPSGIPNRAPFTNKGLYLFSFTCLGTSVYYPIYIGITGTSFRQRLMGPHTIRDVIVNNRLCVPAACGNIQGQLYWTLISNDNAVTSKFIESVFLATFNFALNTEENRDYRHVINDLAHQVQQATSEAALHNILGKTLTDNNNFIVNEGL